MKFPRVHVFIDASCPALTSGKLSIWAKPAKLISLISPTNENLSPDGAEAAKSIRWWRSRQTPRRAEVQMILEGDISTGLMTGLGNHILDTLRFVDDEAIFKAELFAQLVEDTIDFEESARSAAVAFESFHETLFEIDPGGDHAEASLLQELDAMLNGNSPSQMFTALDALAESFAIKSIASHRPQKKAA